MHLLDGDETNRYVLIQNFPDGRPRTVRSVANLIAGEQEMRKLIERGEAGWYLFDTKEKRNVWPREPELGPKVC
jgi:hypothetical protein